MSDWQDISRCGSMQWSEDVPVSDETAIVVTSSLPIDNKAGQVILNKFLILLGRCFKTTYAVVSGKESDIGNLPQGTTVLTTNTEERHQSNIFWKIGQHIKSQIKVCKILEDPKLAEGTVFFWNASMFLIPMLYARIRGRLTVLFRFGDPSVAPQKKYGGLKGKIISAIVSGLETSCLYLCTYVAVEHRSIVETTTRLKRFISKTLEISLYVDVKQFAMGKPSRERSIDVAYVGRLAPEKGIDQLLSALTLLDATSHRPNMIIIGSGLFENTVRQKIRQLPWVRLEGWIDYQGLPQFLADTKLLVVPSTTEGLPNVVLEAMACGTPCIATQVGGIPGVVIPEETGWLIDDNEAGTIRNAIIAAVCSKKLKNFSRNAREFVVNNYSLPAATARLFRSLEIMHERKRR